MSYRIYLDDRRECPSGFVPAKSYEEFVTIISTLGMPDFISFDHDLADEHYPWNDPGYPAKLSYDSYKEKTGLSCAQYLIDNELGLPKEGWQVHSHNYVGKENIEKVLQNYEQELRRRG